MLRKARGDLRIQHACLLDSPLPASLDRERPVRRRRARRVRVFGDTLVGREGLRPRAEQVETTAFPVPAFRDHLAVLPRILHEIVRREHDGLVRAGATTAGVYPNVRADL